jgi:hypothetical protein
MIVSVSGLEVISRYTAQHLSPQESARPTRRRARSACTS